jgi:cytosine/adenosine deaminase-related metal-dependent hydrolase
LRITAGVKASFPLNENDLYCRAQRLIIDSLDSGVTSMRAHVEVDTIVGLTCLNVALRLQKEWFALIEIQVCGVSKSQFEPHLNGCSPM